MRAILRYHGAKWRIAERIVELMPASRVYVEPFGGSAAVLLNRRRVHLEVYNDVDSYVVRFFRALREQPGELAHLVALTPFSREEFDAAREAYEGADDLEAARRFLVRSWQGRGGYQASARTGWWVQTARDGGGTTTRCWATLPSVLMDAAERLRDVTIECDDWWAVCQRYDHEDTLHYLDPPYVGGSRGYGRRYVEDLYAATEHQEILDKIVSLKGMVMLSGYASTLYEERLKDWRCVEISTRALSGGARTECLWFSPACGNRQLEIAFEEAL